MSQIIVQKPLLISCTEIHKKKKTVNTENPLYFFFLNTSNILGNNYMQANSFVHTQFTSSFLVKVK